MACTYTLIDANGQQVTLNGPAEFKAYLVESGLKQFYPDGKYPWSPKAVEIQPSAQIDFKASQAFADRLINGESFKTIVQARKALTTQTIEAGTELAKKADEAIELAGILAARRIVNQGMSQSETFDALTKIADQMPTLSVRTSESIAQQAYSTPLPLAYVASVRAGITKQTTVVEPTAGNGALVMAANPKLTTVNELNKSRFDSLNKQGFDAINDDAVDHNFGNRDADVVIANPPFGVIKDENNKTISFHIAGGYNTNEIDHAIALNALKAMSENGKAVLIVGGPSKMLSDEKRSDAYNGKAKRSFYFTLYNQYNVTDHFTVSGDLYAKQGAAWPVDVIVIDGVGKSNLQLPAANLPRIINSIEELKNELKGNQTGLRQAPVTVEQATRSQTETGDEGRNLAVEPSTDTESNQNGQSSSVLSGLRGHTERNGSDGRNLRQQNDNISGRPARTDKPTDTVENKFQAPYRPGSAVNPVGTLVPVNMQASVETAIQRVIDKHGDLDTYVADLLDYPVADIGKYFSAEQVDAIALALDNIESGKGFIIGDQTGVGKGRVNAAMIRYAIKNGITPIFVTEKANLYGDMVRDLQDIGSGDVRPFATNSGASIPMDADANEWYEKKLQAEEKGEKAPAKYGKFLTFGTPAKQDKNMQAMAEKGSLIDADVIFTTYSQMQTVKGAETNRMRFLEKMGDGALVILDESHNAGGGTENKEGEAVGRAGMARKLVAISKGVFYSSATYAKRPDVLDLYSKTDMGLVANVNVLKESLIAGGIALQQSIASMLARSGQYIRREKSFDGIIYNTSNVEVDKKMAEKTSEIMREIMKFDDLKQGAMQTIKSDLKAEGSIITGNKATGSVGAESINFSSVMHNMIGQMLLILKTKPAIDEAIAALKRGEKPVITLSNTMGSVIAEYASDMGLNVGDAIDLDIGYLLKRYAQKSRRVTITNAYGEKETKSLSDDELGPLAVRQFNKIINLINDFDFSGFPISPIDYIHHELAKAGYKSNEITGRTVGADYTTGTPTYKTRPAQDKTPAGKRKIINDFNNGKIDVIILNQSGSTGISLHSSPKVGSDTRKRHMIVAQPELNIDTHMQMLGRINRTGQLNLPSYSQLAADIPAEKRPSAILAKKMAMLNANTTAGKESAVKAKDVPDFMNQYGDEIVAAVMRENPEVHKVLGEPLGKDFDKEGAIAKVSGRIPVLTLKEQETLYQLIEDEYNDYIDTLNKTGENKLEASAMDLDAKTIKEEIVVQPIGDSDSPFAEAVVAKTVDAKKLGKPYSLDQIKELIAKQGITDSESKQKAVDSFLEKTKTEYQSALAEIDKMDDSDQLAIDRKNSALNTLNYQRDNLERMYKQFLPGKGVLLTSPTGMQYLGITGKFERKGTGKNYFAQGQWKVTVYVADASKQLVIPLSKLSQENDPSRWTIEIEPISTVTSALEEGLSSTREERVILTGNMLAAYGFNKTGQIVNYTDENGDIQQGVLMPKKFDLKKAIEAKPVIFDAPEMAIDFVNDMDVSIKSLRSDDNNVRLVISNYGNNLYVPASKAKGGMYFNNKRLTELLGNFVKRGSEMVVKVYPSEVQETIRALYQLVDSMQPVSKEEGKKFLEKKGIKFSKTKKSTGSTVAEVTAMLPKRVKKLINAGKLKIVQTSTEKTEAYYDTKNDVLVLVADMLNKDNLESVLGHELFHRAKTTDSKTKAAFDKFENQLNKRFQLARGGEGSAIEQRAAQRVIDANTPVEDRIEEFGAYLVTEYKNLPVNLKKIIGDFIAAIRMTLLRHGLDMGFIKTLTPADLYALSKYGANAKANIVFKELTEEEQFKNAEKPKTNLNGKKTIDVDGIERPTTNSIGNEIHWSEEGVRNFWRWFGDSQIIDKEGRPLVIYHGTRGNIESFDLNKFGQTDFGFYGIGIYSSANQQSANSYAVWDTSGKKKIVKGANVLPLYSSLQNPYFWPKDKSIANSIEESKSITEDLKSQGYDGVVISQSFDKHKDTSKFYEVVAFNPEQVKSSIGNVGAFNVENDAIRYSKQSPTEIADTLKQVFKPVEGKQELGWLAGFFQRNHLIDFVASELPEIKDYKLFAQGKDNFVNQSERVIAERYDEFKSKMNSKVMHELGRVQGLATRLANFDPAEANASDAMTDKEREVFDAYTAMPDSAKEVYKAMRDDYRKDLQTKKQALIQRIKDFKAGDKATAKIIKKIELHFDKFLTKGVYFPLNRDGNIVIVALDPDGEKTVQFVESNKERDNLIAAMKEQGYTDIKTSLKQTINRNVLIGNAANEIVGLADRTINDLRDAVDNGNLDEQEINAMFDEFNQLLLNALPDTSYRKHFIHRKGTLGESTDALRAYAKTRNSATRNIAALKFDSKIRNVLQQARKDVKKLNLENSQSIDGVLNELERREEALANTDTNVASQLLTSLGFMGALGFNIGSAAVNMMQVAGVTFPELAGKYSTKEAYSEIQKAYKLLFNPAVLNKKSGFDLTENPAINSITKKALAKLQDIGKIDLTMTHDAISAGQNPSYSENIINRTVGNFAKYSGYFFHVAEALNRQVTAIAAFNLAYAKNGGDFDAAIADTIDVIDRTQFDYGAGNRARYMMGNTVRVLTLFKTYALGISYYIGRNVHNALKGESPEVRLQAKKTLAVQMAMTFATSGIFGLPLGIEAFMALGGVAGFKYKGANFAVAGAVGGALVFQALLAGLGADDDDDLETQFRNWLTDNFDATTAEWITKGPARLLPIGDLSGRTGQRHLWWQPQNKQLEGTDQYNAFASAFMGPIGSQISSLFTAKKMYEDGQYSRMIESMSPAAIRNAVAAYRMSTEGVTTLKGQKIVKDLSYGDVINKTIGFTPNVIANAYDANSAIAKKRDKYEMQKTHLVNRYINADKEGRADLMANEIKAFNATVTREQQITMKSLLKSMKARKAAGKHTEQGLYLSKKQESFREEGRFAKNID